MFCTAGDRSFPQPAVPLAGVVDHPLGIPPPAAATERVLDPREMIEIQHWREIQIESQVPQKFSGEGTGIRAFEGLPMRAQRGGRWGDGRDVLRARDPSAFLIDRDDGHLRREIPQIIGESACLLRRYDVAREQDESRRLQAPEKIRLIHRQFRPGHPEHQ